MTWGEFKKKMQQRGVTDGAPMDFIDWNAAKAHVRRQMAVSGLAELLFRKSNLARCEAADAAAAIDALWMEISVIMDPR